MLELIRLRRRVSVAVALGCASLALASIADAVDLRDWGRKYNTASERFVVLTSFKSEAVLDKETQLVWRRAAASAGVWVNALQYCNSSGTGDRYGWRLPSLSELSSLLGTGGALAAGHPFLGVPDQAHFWSSTDVSYDTNFAYTRKLTGNSVGTGLKTGYYHYLCVRGAGSSAR